MDDIKTTGRLWDRKGIMRYYLKNSAAFDSPPYIYHTEKYKEAVKRSGGKNVRTALQYGWSCMPRVVTWSADRPDDFDRATVQAIHDALEKCPPFAGGGNLPCPLITAYSRRHSDKRDVQKWD